MALGFALPQASASPYRELNGTVVIEAEHWTEQVAGPQHSWTYLDSSTFLDVRGDGYVMAWPDLRTPLGGPRPIDGGPFAPPYLRYDFCINNPGVYLTHVRATAFDGKADSIFISFDGSPDFYNDSFHHTVVGSFDGMWESDGLPNDAAGVEGREPMLIGLTAGTHSLYLYMRQDGALVDSLALTLDHDIDLNTIPQDSLPESPACVTPEPTGLAMFGLGLMIVLTVRRRR